MTLAAMSLLECRVSNRDKNGRDKTIVPHFYHNTSDIVFRWRLDRSNDILYSLFNILVIL